MKSQRTSWCVRWEALLRAYPHSSPLSNPEILVFKIPETCDEILEQLHLMPRGEAQEVKKCICSCGLDPMQGFYQVGKEAMNEAILRALQTVPGLSIADRRSSQRELEEVMDKLQANEIALLCSMCQLRPDEQAAAECQLVASTRVR